MALVAKVSTGRDTFAAGRALVGTNGLTVALERVVPTGESVVPYFWVWGTDVEAYESNLASEPGIRRVETVTRADDGTLFRVEWQTGTSVAIRELFDLEFAMLDGVCTLEGWSFEVRFPSTDAARRFQRHLNDREIPHSFERVCPTVDGAPAASGELTDQQREALLAAYRVGYFEEPRETDLGELADRLGISPSAASGRLRRGYAAMIEDRFVSGTDEGSGRPAAVYKHPK